MINFGIKPNTPICASMTSLVKTVPFLFSSHGYFYFLVKRIHIAFAGHLFEFNKFCNCIFFQTVIYNLRLKILKKLLLHGIGRSNNARFFVCPVHIYPENGSNPVVVQFLLLNSRLLAFVHLHVVAVFKNHICN
jgi:hypothetical protein